MVAGGVGTAAMLALYYLRILQPTKRFTATIIAEGGSSALIGIGINVLILGVASLWLIIDFGMIEKQVQFGAPKQMEWFCAFILMVTLV